MSNKTLLASPVTQSREAVKQLIKYYKHHQEPSEMPAFFRLTGEMALVGSNKKDAYYVVTPRGCTCPAATYHPGQPCKHAREYFPQPKVEAGPVMASIRPEGKWPGGFNRPVNLLSGEKGVA
jgi:hypothetical protein